MSAISISKRSNGGFTITATGLPVKYCSELTYLSYDTVVKLIDPLAIDQYADHLPADFTINGVTGFTTIAQVCDALDALTVGKSNVQSTDQIIRTFKVTITLPANQNAYAAGDVITDISGNLSQLTNVAKAAGCGVTILGVRVQTTDASGLAGKNLRWHVFNDSITPIADNAAFSIADANTDKQEGTITVTMGTGAFAKVGQSNYENLSLNPVSRNIYLVLEDADGHTPSANSTVINAYFKCLLYN